MSDHKYYLLLYHQVIQVAHNILKHRSYTEMYFNKTGKDKTKWNPVCYRSHNTVRSCLLWSMWEPEMRAQYNFYIILFICLFLNYNCKLRYLTLWTSFRLFFPVFYVVFFNLRKKINIGWGYEVGYWFQFPALHIPVTSIIKNLISFWHRINQETARQTKSEF